MRIAFLTTRISGVDGVSLEIPKLAHVFEELGHECFYCAGKLDPQFQPGREIPMMHFNDPAAKEIYTEVFNNPSPVRETYRRIYSLAEAIRDEIESFIEDYKIDILMPQNSSTIPMNISLGIAIEDVIKRNQIKTICHHHDFYWERDRYLNNAIQDILNSAFPPNLQPVKHLVISSIMKRRLRSWLGIEAYYLPNVCDFESPPPSLDEYALTLRREIGVNDDDLIVLQPTRIVRRKNIEKAIELVRKLQDPRLVLVITGYEGDEHGEYGKWLHEEAQRANIRYRFIGDYIDSVRGEQNGHKVYTLADVYPQAHFVTYPSTYEGFGNALIETLYYRKPIVVHTYPAYLTDIKPKGVRAVEFYHDIDERVIQETRQIIDDAALRDEIVEHNYQVGLQHFSLKTLRLTLYKVLYDLAHD